MNKPWIVGMTGASGAIYGVRLVEELLARGHDLHLVITDAGWRVLYEELDWDIADRKLALSRRFSRYEGTYQLHPIRDIGAGPASGTFRAAGMVVVPCSMGTLSGIAHGSSDNLLLRTADVMMKEGRRLIVVPRETPLHTIHLGNMLTLAQMGVRILPAMPGFYNKPTSLEEIVDFLVGKILDAMDIDHDLYVRWGETDGTKQSEDQSRAD